MKFNAIKKLNILSLLICISCNKIEKPAIDSSMVITEAKIISYDDLKTRFDYNCYCYPDNWRDGIEFDKEKAFYVSAKINNRLLAELCENESFQIKDMLNDNIHSLYGKYINRWEFTNSNGDLICETHKFEGQNLLELNRKGEVDELIIGPLIEKPNKMGIKILDSKYYANNLSPQIQIK